jgi:PAS domain S-box-containing protein
MQAFDLAEPRAGAMRLRSCEFDRGRVQSYETYRNRLIRAGLNAAAPAISLLVALYAVVEATWVAERFWPAAGSYAVMIAVPLAGWLASRLLDIRHQQLILLAADLAFTGALLSQIPQPTTSADAAAASTSLKMMATATFFPWAPRLQAVSAAVTLILYWAAVVFGGRVGEPSLALFKIVLPLVAAGLSIVGAVVLERARRTLVASLERQRSLEAEQREQVELLRDRDRRLELLLEQMPAALWSTDAQLRFTSARGRHLDVIGMAEDRRQAPTVQEFFGTEDVDFAPVAAHRAALTGESRTYEFTWHDFVFQTRVEPLRDADGRIAGTIGVAQDITESRRAEVERAAMARVVEEDAAVSAALAEFGQGLIAALATPAALSERLAERLARSLQCDSATLLLRDADTGDYTYATSYGLLPEAREISRILRFRHADFALFFERLATGAVVQFRAAGEAATRWAALPQSMGIAGAMYVALRRSDEMIGFVAVHRHSAESGFARWQSRALQEMANLAALALDNARLLEELERASALKSEFLATMSHELRTPLNAIIGYNALILDGEFGDLTDLQRETIEKVLESAHELFQLISATLDLSRLEAGRLPVSFANTDPRALLAEVAGESRMLRRRPQVQIRWNVPAGLPVLLTDAAKLKVVLKNLISNAAKFTETGSIVVDARPVDGGAEFAVIDTGCGIPPEQQEAIFEPFRQVDQSNTRTHGGVGLGLYIVRRFVDLLGGTVRVESEPGRGTTFRVWIPAVTPGNGAAAQSEARP